MGTGWRTVLTDLSLILFMVTASVLPEQPGAVARPGAAAPASPAADRAQPVAVWRPGPGAPSLAQWLAGADARAVVSVRVTYRDDRAAAMGQALGLSRGAGERVVRLLVEPGPADTAEATLAYDAPARAAEPPQRARAMARGLQSG